MAKKKISTGKKSTAGAAYSSQQAELRNALSLERKHTRIIAIMALFAALSYVGFQFLRIDIPVGTAKTAFHFGNVFVMLAALLIGGWRGGIAGAVGMTIADLTSGYATSALPTFILKLGIGLVVALVGHRVLALRTDKDPRNWVWKAALACGAGAVFNLIADPLFRYVYNLLVYNISGDLAAKLVALGALTTLVNAIIATVAGTLLYTALRPALSKNGWMI